jgi:hypothetical protein
MYNSTYISQNVLRMSTPAQIVSRRQRIEQHLSPGFALHEKSCRGIPGQKGRHEPRTTNRKWRRKGAPAHSLWRLAAPWLALRWHSLQQRPELPKLDGAETTQESTGDNFRCCAQFREDRVTLNRHLKLVGTPVVLVESSAHPSLLFEMIAHACHGARMSTKVP